MIQEPKSHLTYSAPTKSPSDHLLGLLPTVVTAILGIIASVVACFIGRRANLDELRIKHGQEHAEKLATTFEKLLENLDDTAKQAERAQLAASIRRCFRDAPT